MEPVEVSTPTPPLDAPPTEAPAESIAAHAEQFNAPKLERVEPDDRPRHRAKSQQATAADVPRINELTKKLREAEARIATYERAPRVEPSTPSATSTAPPSTTVTPPTAGSGFADPEPTLDRFADKDDPYAAWQRALATWDRKKEAFEERQSMAERSRGESEAQADHARLQAHATRLQTFIADRPDFGAKLQAAMAVDDRVPALLERAIMEDDNGPAILYHLLDHPDVLDEMRLLTDGKAVTSESVAFLRRRLRSYAQQAAQTGSAAAGVFSQMLAPRPPNPVRTGPMHTADDPSGEQGSIADHAKAYGRRR